MADNSTLDPGVGGDTIRDKDRTGVKTQIVGLDLNIAGAESLMAGSMPVNDNAGSLTVDDGGGSLTVDGPLTDVQLRASVVPVGDGGGSLTVDGTVTANAGTGPWPVTDNGGSLTVDGTVDTELTTADLDTGAGADTRAVVGLVRAESGGGVLIGSANPMPVNDAGGSLTVDGTVAVSSLAGTVDVSDRDARLAGRAKILDSAGAVIDPALKGQLPAALVGGRLSVDASGAAVPVTDNGGSLTVDGTVTADTELPAAAALADGAANPTVPGVGGFGMVWNGATWDRLKSAATGDASGAGGVAAAALFGFNGAGFDRLRSDIANGLDVDVTRVGGGDVDHDAVNTAKVQQVGGHASPVDVPPTLVSANGDRVRLWLDRSGSQVMRRRKLRETYTCVFRLAEAAARLDQTFTQVANTTKQWGTIYHTAAATKEVRLQKWLCYLTSDTVAAVQGVFELRELTGATAPATGNPAITPKPRRVGGAAAEAVALYLPTTQGSETAVNSPLGHIPFDTGISGAVSTVNPVPVLDPIILFDASLEDDEALQPTLPVGTAGGWAASVRTVGAPVLRITMVAVFTEEIP